MSIPPCSSISGLILAGGQAVRMRGQDKGLVPLADKPLISHVIERLKPQLALLRINANRNLDRYRLLAAEHGLDQQSGFAVIDDSLADYQGPLAGIARGLEGCPSEWLLVCPCDTPQLPTDLVSRMVQQLQTENAQIAVAHDGERAQPVVALIHRELYPSLIEFLAGGERKILCWYRRHRLVQVDFSDQADAFINLNSIQDIEQLESPVP